VSEPINTCDADCHLKQRELLSAGQAGEMSALFKVFANDTRLRLLHELIRRDQACVSDIGAALGMSSQAVSNQLQRLVDRRILTSRREGNNVYYRIINPCVKDLLDRAFCFIEKTNLEPQPSSQPKEKESYAHIESV
jgi:DNA-binding transcriptional ArsR family regulator